MSRRRPSLSYTVRRLLHDLVTLARLGVTSRAHLAAENLFTDSDKRDSEPSTTLNVSDEYWAMPRRPPSSSCTVRRLFRDLVTLVRLGLTSRAQRAAANLFLRKQLA